MSVAGVAHPVERHLAKVEVASSSLVTRSIKRKQMRKHLLFFFVELGGDRLEDMNASLRWRLARRWSRRRRLHSVSSLVTHSTAVGFYNIRTKKGHTAVWPFIYFSESACSRNGSNTFFRTRELK